jgi:peptidoglycan/xylan/chitin deacetylase (PgdA/CDA1 family)
VRPPSDLPRLAGYRAICNSKDCLEALLDHVQAMNLEVVSMDAVPGRVRQPGGRRFVAFTFDDGCRDNLEWVCPMFARRGWPLTLYICPGLTDGTAPLWWHYFEELVHRVEMVELEELDLRLPTSTRAERELAYDALCTAIRASDQRLANQRAGELLHRHGIDWQQAPGTALMNWEEIQTLSQSPLVTLGAHSLTHRTLKLLDDDELEREMRGSKQVLEERIGRPVRHFSYPFGGRNAVDERVAAMGVQCGFETLVTTRGGNLFAAHQDHLSALPRVTWSGNFESLLLAEALISGLATSEAAPFTRLVAL